MIAEYKSVKGHSGDCAVISYLTGDEPETPPRAPVFTNLAGRNAKELAQEVAVLRSLRPRLNKAGVHLILSHSPYQRTLTIEEWREAVRVALKMLGAESVPYAAWLHTEKAHQHIHVFFLRIRQNGSVVTDSKSYKKAECVARCIEQHLGLQPPVCRRPEVRHASSQGAGGKRARYKYQRLSVAHSEQDLQKGTVSGVIDPHVVMSAVDNSLDFEELITRLREVGIETKVKHLPGEAEPVGWSMRNEGPAGVWTKGSGVHPDLSLRKVLNRIRERHCEIERETELKRRQRTQTIFAKRPDGDHSRRFLKTAFSRKGVIGRDRQVTEDANLDTLAVEQMYPTKQAQLDHPATVESIEPPANSDALEYSPDLHRAQSEHLNMFDLPSAKATSEAGALTVSAESRPLPAPEFQEDQFERLRITERTDPLTKSNYDQHWAETEDLDADEDATIDQDAEDISRYERERFR